MALDVVEIGGADLISAAVRKVRPTGIALGGRVHGARIPAFAAMTPQAPPALVRASVRSDKIRRGPTPVTSPDVRCLCPVILALMAYSSCLFSTGGLV